MKQLRFDEFAQIRDERSVRLIDVRERDEWEAVRVKGAELHALSRIRVGDLPTDDGREVFIICRSGARSASAALVLEAAGWPEMTNISNGTIGAIQAGEEFLERG